MRYETVLAELGRLRHGIIRVEDAVAAGVSLSDLRNLRRRRGVLVPVGRGVQRLRDHPFDLDCRRQAALDLAGDGAVLGLRTAARLHGRSEEHTSELQSLMRISYAGFCLKKTIKNNKHATCEE